MKRPSNLTMPTSWGSLQTYVRHDSRKDRSPRHIAHQAPLPAATTGRRNTGSAGFSWFLRQRCNPFLPKSPNVHTRELDSAWNVGALR
jgi:hypothetical protein